MVQSQYDHCAQEICHIREHVARLHRMVREDQDYTDILIELTKARSAVTGLSKELLAIHVRSDLDAQVRQRDSMDTDKLKKLLMTYVK